MRAFETEKTEVAEIDRSVYDIKDKVNAAFEVNSGLTAEIVEQISKEKHDPDWMREFRLKALDIYNKASIPNWGPSLEGLDMRNIVTYVRPNTEMRGKWSEVPDDIKNTFERLGIPQAERSSLAGVGAQYDSEVVYHNVKEEVAAQGVVYTDMESALTGPYADAESFAADCIGIMQLAADKDLGFTSYHFSSGEDTDDGISYYLDCVASYPAGLTAAQVAQRVQAAGASILRGGAFKPRTSPYSFQGLRAEGLELLQEARKVTGQPIVTELMNNEHIPLFVDAKVDMIQIGARNMQNFELLKAVGKLNVPVLLKRGLSSTLEELVMSAEYIMAEGNPNVVLCERGIRTFETSMRNTLDISAVPMLKKMTHLPVVIDPSHAAGIAFMVPALAQAAVAVGADGLMIETHNDPAKAKSDGAQSLTPDQFDALMNTIKPELEFFGKTLN